MESPETSSPDGTTMRNMAGHEQIAPTDIRALATTSDGACFVIGAEDGSIRLLATDPLNHLDSARAHPGGVLTLGIVEKQTDTFVFSSGEDCRVRRWRLADDRLLDPVDLDEFGSDNQGHAIAVTGRWVASAAHDGLLRVCDHDGSPIAAGECGIQVFAMSASADGRLLAVGGTDGGRAVAQVWRVNQTQIRRQKSTSMYDCAAFRSILVVDNKKIVLGGDDARMTEWNWTTDPLASFGNSHGGPVHTLVRVTDRMILSGSSDGRVLRWNLANGQMIEDTGLNFPGGVFALAVPTASPKPMVFAAGGHGELRVLRDGRPVERPFSGHRGAVRAISVSEQGDFVVTGSADGTARIWNKSGMDEGVLTGHTSAVSAVATWPGDNSRVITGGEDGTIVVWNRFDQSRIGTTMAHGAQVWALAVSPDGRRIFSGGNDRKVRVWRADKHTQIDTPLAGSRKAVSAIAISGNGAHAVIGEDDGNVVFWEFAKERPSTSQKAVAEGQVRSVAIDFEGSVAAVGGQDGGITVWNPRTGRQLGDPIRTNHRDVRKVLLSKDGDTVVSCGADGSIERWDRRTGRRTGHVRPDFAATGSVEAIALMPDDELIVAGDSEGEIDLVRTTPDTRPPRGPSRKDSHGRATDPPHPKLTSDEPTTDDAIGNTADVRAIAEMISARHTPTPLSVALLGDWGSGKSSIVLQVESHVHALASNARQDPASSFWTGNVRQIRFNAWHYSDVELWVGLIEQIIHGLRQPEQAPPAESASESEESEAVKAQHEELSRLVDEATQEIDHANAPRTSLLRRARHLGRAMAKLTSAGKPISKRLADARQVVRKRWRVLLVATAAVALAVPLALLGRSWLPGAHAWLLSTGAGVATVLISAVTAARKFSKHTDKLRDVLLGQIDDFRVERDRLATRRGELDPVYQLRQVLDELGTSDAYTRHRGVVGSVHQDLRKLADALHRANQAPTPGTPPAVERIVLYVDDLDRCAPERAMKVLEAVNLLQSMRVFIVVVAVNPQVLCEELKTAPEYAFLDDEQRYRHVLNLLDKVFNVVYAVRPLGTRRKNYLMSLLNDIDPEPVAEPEPEPETRADTATNGTRQPALPDPWKPLATVYPLPEARPWDSPNRTLRISQGEVDLLVSLAELLPGPRAVKKLTNIYRLVLADQYHRRTHYLGGDYQAAAIMVAGLVRDPAEFAKLIDHLGVARCPEQGHQDVMELLGSAGELGTVLSRIVGQHVPAPLRCAELYRGWSVQVARYSFETYRGFLPS